jgi:hypothetical protein
MNPHRFPPLCEMLDSPQIGRLVAVFSKQTYGLLGGVGGALLMTPAFASIGNFSDRRRVVATGIANTSGSTSGMVILLLLQSVIDRIGFRVVHSYTRFSSFCPRNPCKFIQRSSVSCWSVILR